MKYTCINIQGNLISEEILQKIEKAEAQGQLAGDFWFEPGTNLRSEIEYAWSRIKLDWKHFSERGQNLPSSDQYGTTLSRKWMEQFLTSIGFHLDRQKSSLQGGNTQTYTISHTAENIDQLPIHIVGFFEPNHPDKNTLDIKTSGGTSRFSPHGTMQEYLNVTEHLYGIATNGLYLRLIRDTGRLIKLTYLEFDIKRMLDEDKYSEFTILFRILHASRFPGKKEESDQCLIEKYYHDSIETGNRIRDGLSLAVKESLVALGKGFLQHENNSSLREKIHSGSLSSKDYYRQLLRIIYRFLFLMVTEERNLIYDPDDKSEKNQRFKKLYFQFYSIHRLRKLSENRYVYEGQFTDLWQGLVNTFLLFEARGNGKQLGIQPLDGDLFSFNAISDLQNSLINNKLLLECVRNLNEFTDENKNLVPINYRSLDVEELGSVYEGLLELHPVIENIETSNPAYINFTFHEGTDRKTTGSYYTRPELVNELIKSALIPLIEERLKEQTGDREAQAKALLKLKVCDPAAGSGHMLLAAARTIAWYLARVQSGEENPAPSVYRGCLRDVIQHCIYAVDFNPDAVELCKLALWLEGHNSGKPLSFLDHKIRNGNSLVGVADLTVLKKGIPDDAFNAVTGDDKDVCRELKKVNTQYNKTKQRTLDFDQIATEEKHNFSANYHQLEDIKQDDVEAVQQVKTKFEELRNNRTWLNDWNACNLWTAAFFFHYIPENKQAVATSERLASFLSYPAAAYGPMLGKATAVAIEHKFFHWSLEFPDVFEQGGFDVMLGNPPWERIKLQQEEFFATRDPIIANAPNAFSRSRLISNLPNNNPILYEEYLIAMHDADAIGKFLRVSGRCELTAVGDINTYSVFAELFSSLINKRGNAGFIVPTGIATDDSNKDFFGALIEKNKLISLFDFENREAIFQSVHRSYKFSLLTLAGSDIGNRKARFGFFLTRIEHLQDKLRMFSLSKKDFLILNPNTKTCPVFRTSVDAELTNKTFKRIGVFIDESKNLNPWYAYYIRLVDLGDHQREIELFHLKNESTHVFPVYEAKLFWQMDHRFATFSDLTIKEIENGTARQLSEDEKSDSKKKIITRYYANVKLFNELMSKYPTYNKSYFIVWRDISNSTNERTSVSSIIPKILASRSCPGIGFDSKYPAILLVSNLNSIIYDYFVRQKISGVHYNWGLLKQTPIISHSDYEPEQRKSISLRSCELIYTSWDIKSFADDVWKEADQDLKAAIKKQWEENRAATRGHEWNPPEWCEIDEEGCPLPPFKWNEYRRSVLKAELDAIYAKLYGLTTEELRYILDPQDVYGPDFPGETFRVLKEKEIRNYGEYRTKRLVLDSWERLNKGQLETPISISKEIKTNIQAMKEFSLNEGIYSVQDVVQITHLKAEKVRRWFNELSKANYEGLSSEQKLDVYSMRISFHGLIELVVIGTLRENSFSLKKILKARSDLKSKTNKIYPFATNNVRDDLKITDKTIIFNFPTGYVTLDGTGQYNLSFIVQFFKQIEFDVEGIALKLFPLPDSKLIVIDPRQSGGKAAINGKGVWVETISSAYSGLNSIDIIQDQYDLNKEEVLAALEYYQ